MKCPICSVDNLTPNKAAHLSHFYRCNACGGYFNTEPDLNPSYPETYFSDRSERETILQKILKIFLWLRLQKIRGLVSGTALILDYGCGNGKLVKYLRANGMNMEGFDPSVGAVSLAQKEGLPVYEKIPDKQYDLIMFWHSLEHTDHPLQDLQNISRNLKPDGKLLIAVPNGDSLEAHLFHKTWFCYDWPFHRVHFTPNSLTQSLVKSGFRVMSVDHFNPEYTVSSLAQSCLNIFLPKNALYGIAANRRGEEHGQKVGQYVGILSLLLLLVFSPILLIIFLIALISRRTAALIVTAKREK